MFHVIIISSSYNCLDLFGWFKFFRFKVSRNNIRGLALCVSQYNLGLRKQKSPNMVFMVLTHKIRKKKSAQKRSKSVTRNKVQNATGTLLVCVVCVCRIPSIEAS